MELVAHRAGNHAHSIGAAAAGADAVELDVHLLRGRLEVRHAKAVWPFRLYWERGEGLLPDEQPPALADLIAAAPPGTRLWIDLKGFTGRLAGRVLREIGPGRELTMSCRSWWALGPARRARLRTYRSVGNRAQLWLALRLRHPDGVVLHERFATAEAIGRLRRRCERIAVWAVIDAERARDLHDLGVDTFIVDDFDLITSLRRR